MKQEKCPYCRGEKYLVTDNGVYILITKNFMEINHGIYKAKGFAYTSRKIGYCPICGRKLED